MLEGCECKARARLSEAVDALTCNRGAEAGVGGITGVDPRSIELGGTGVECADSKVGSWSTSGLAACISARVCAS